MGAKKGQSILVLAVPQMTLIQNNQHAEVAYLGVAYSAPLQLGESFIQLGPCLECHC